MFLRPFPREIWHAYGPATTAVATYLRMMYLKYRYQMGYEVLVKEVSDSSAWRRFCHLSLGDRVPDSTTLIKLTHKYGEDTVRALNSTLGQLCDISEVIRHYNDSLDWNLIEKTSQENGVLKGLHFVLHTCQQLSQTPVLASVLDRFQPREFNLASAELFIRRRVLDTRPWLAHGLMDSQLAFSRRRMIWAIASRFSNFTKDIIKKQRWSQYRDFRPETIKRHPT